MFHEHGFFSKHHLFQPRDGADNQYTARFSRPSPGTSEHIWILRFTFRVPVFQAKPSGSYTPTRQSREFGGRSSPAPNSLTPSRLKRKVDWLKLIFNWLLFHRTQDILSPLSTGQSGIYDRARFEWYHGDPGNRATHFQIGNNFHVIRLRVLPVSLMRICCWYQFWTDTHTLFCCFISGVC